MSKTITDKQYNTFLLSNLKNHMEEYSEEQLKTIYHNSEEHIALLRGYDLIDPSYNPRTWDNLYTMFSESFKNLNDKTNDPVLNKAKNVKDLLYKLSNTNLEINQFFEEYNNIDKLINYFKNKNIFIHLFKINGVTDFSNIQLEPAKNLNEISIIFYVNKSKIKKEYKNQTKKQAAKHVKNLLKAEISQFEDYVNGKVYTLEYFDTLNNIIVDKLSNVYNIDTNEKAIAFAKDNLVK